MLHLYETWEGFRGSQKRYEVPPSTHSHVLNVKALKEGKGGGGGGGEGEEGGEEGRGG